MDTWKPKIEKPGENNDSNSKREAEFSKCVDQILDDTHYTFWNKIGGVQYENKFAHTLAGVLGALTFDSKESVKDLDAKKFVQLLKKNNMKNVAEVGSGTSSESLIFPLSKLLRNADCTMSVVANDLGPASKDMFTSEGINVIAKEAGELQDEKLDLDLVVAHNVFSLGGQFTAGRLNDSKEKLLQRINDSVIDLIHQLSNNPRASIVLMEQYDLLPLDRNLLEKEADILLWEPLTTTNGYIYRANLNDDKIDLHGAYAQDIYNKAPNLVVLRKKAK